MRLDRYLVETGKCESRNKAADLIRNGLLLVNGQTVTKTSYEVKEEDQIEILALPSYVSRAGEKLAFAIEEFGIDVKGKTVLDIGSSTGGFTDCCLQKGAKKVYCVDVGTNQLHQKIRDDERTVVRENTNARNLKKEDFDPIDFICMDVSFISCTLLIPKIAELLEEAKEAVILVKPQFEVGAKNLNKNGIVKNAKAVAQAYENVVTCLTENQLLKCRYEKCPVTGKDGNQEYLLYVRKV